MLVFSSWSEKLKYDLIVTGIVVAVFVVAIGTAFIVGAIDEYKKKRRKRNG